MVSQCLTFLFSLVCSCLQALHMIEAVQVGTQACTLAHGVFVCPCPYADKHGWVWLDAGDFPRHASFLSGSLPIANECIPVIVKALLLLYCCRAPQASCSLHCHMLCQECPHACRSARVSEQCNGDVTQQAVPNTATSWIMDGHAVCRHAPAALLVLKLRMSNCAVSSECQSPHLKCASGGLQPCAFMCRPGCVCMGNQLIQ